MVKIIQIITSIGKDMEKLDPHILLVGLWNGTASLENRLAVPQKVEQKVTLWPSNSTPRYIPKRIENICLHKNLHVNVHSSIIQIAKKWKQLKCPPTNEWINKNALCLYSGILFISKKEWTTDKYYGKWTLKTLCLVRKARYKRPRIIWFHLYDIASLE